MIEHGRAGTGQIPIDEAWSRTRRVLAIRLDNLGDVLVTTPAMHAIKESIPGVELSLLASPVGAQVGRLNPDINEVIVHQAPWMDPWRRLPHDSEREQRLIAAIRERNFDGAVIFSSYHQSPLPAAYLCYVADVPLRLAASIDGPGSLLTTRHKHPGVMMHEVERGLDLVGAVGMCTTDTKLVLAVPESARREVSTAFEHLPRHPLVVVHPGCSMPARTYPWEMFAKIVALLVAQHGATVVLTGTEDERELVERVMARAQAFLVGEQPDAIVSLAGALSFPGLCGLIEQADLTITNNTGPMHISAAVQTPVIALFALTNPPEQWGPWQVPHRVLYHDVPCRICYSRVCPYEHECLRLVSPESVVEAAAELLDETRVPAHHRKPSVERVPLRSPSSSSPAQSSSSRAGYDGARPSSPSSRAKDGAAVHSRGIHRPTAKRSPSYGTIDPSTSGLRPSAQDDGGEPDLRHRSARDDGSWRSPVEECPR